MKEKAAKVIRVVTIPPIEALVMLLILYRTKGMEFGDGKTLMVVALFLTVIPLYAYPAASVISKNKDTRDHQRKMAFIFNFAAYFAAMLLGHSLKYSDMLLWILNAYFVSVLVLTIINKGLKIRASGHACSCTLPYLFLSYYLGGYVAAVCLILYLAELWASVYLKRHTVAEFIAGSAVAWIVFAGSGFVVLLKMII